MPETNCISILQDSFSDPVFSCILVRNDRVLYKERKKKAQLPFLRAVTEQGTG